MLLNNQLNVIQVVIVLPTETLKAIVHENCTKKCPEDCPQNGWMVLGEDKQLHKENIRIKCGNQEL